MEKRVDQKLEGLINLMMMNTWYQDRKIFIVRLKSDNGWKRIINLIKCRTLLHPQILVSTSVMPEGTCKLGKWAIPTNFHQVGLSDRIQDSRLSLKFRWTMIFEWFLDHYIISYLSEIKFNWNFVFYFLRIANLLTREMFLVQNCQDYCSKT